MFQWNHFEPFGLGSTVELSWHFPALGKCSNSFKAHERHFVRRCLEEPIPLWQQIGSVRAVVLLLGAWYRATFFSQKGAIDSLYRLACQSLLWTTNLKLLQPPNRAFRLCHDRLNRQHPSRYSTVGYLKAARSRQQPPSPIKETRAVVGVSQKSKW